MANFILKSNYRWNKKLMCTILNENLIRSESTVDLSETLKVVRVNNKLKVVLCRESYHKFIAS